MRITCSRNREQIIRDRDAYQSRVQQKRAKREEQSNKYKSAYRAVMESVKQQVADELSAFADLNLEIQVSNSFDDLEHVRVDIYSNRNNVHDPNKALSWDYKAYIKPDGEVKKESGSWSGLNAVTPENIASLKQSVACLEVINSLDWEAILTAKTPQMEDYVDLTPEPEDPDAKRDFNTELLEADIEDAMAAGDWIKGHGYKYYRSSAVAYYKVLKESPSQYTVAEGNPARGDTEVMPYRVSKTTFFGLIGRDVEIWEG